MSTKQKNILYLLHLPPPVHGSSIVGEFVKESLLINNSFHGRYINLLMSRSVNETGKTSLIKLFRFVTIWFELFGKLIYRRPNLCYYALSTTGAAFYKDCLMVGLLRLFQIRTIYHLHNKGVRQNQNKKINNLLYRFVFKNSSVILLSEQLYLDVERYVLPWKVYYCPNGIKDYQMEAELFSLPEAKIFKILFLSNLFTTKGVFDLIDACSLLKEKGYLFKCDFIGGEGDVNEEQFNDYVKQKRLTEHVKYLGKRFGKLKEMAYEQADVFVLPTYYPNECFPLVILEAMQHSLPVISTFEGGIPDMVKDGINGFLIPQRNVIALEERLELLLRYPLLRKQMGKDGRIKYENNFTLNIFEHKLLSILQDAIK
ncbi:MAG TPA: glycosyltransferase [Petrimonas sp.]|uniref:glycosyltransferase family 4 protein n=1 Tax=Petrimonas sp. TaxID=2023866 RepID=UPI0009665EB2|nr:glycosyltransferase [Petrimonas sp.]OJV37185.1 MAG: glycosyl transferase family 1 [Bacteroidia bacterium 43-41]MEA4979418.1 glycosyltransferase [Petrimonas sp.]MEA5046303.1 glycosyltransferase [Petrimonas sp.]MEA5063450.1 glycosyltransferase [Petrimonas sp.]